MVSPNNRGGNAPIRHQVKPPEPGMDYILSHWPKGSPRLSPTSSAISKAMGCSSHLMVQLYHKCHGSNHWLD